MTEKIYDKLCVMHSDISAIKTKQVAQDRDIKDVESKSDAHAKFIDKVKGGMILLSSGAVIFIIKRYML